ncbi:hypothetical protein U9M48_006265 [Paspalum notatum var. saurae]|uniref:RIN4 pathogenic type III effector avirulence factor Avr cleavage site domain-containing protein n=1 Tax=Paspalum notatum var. saurae TaxID=547442 RepID=A0AAQ3PZB4_PASNO
MAGAVGRGRRVSHGLVGPDRQETIINTPQQRRQLSCGLAQNRCTKHTPSSIRHSKGASSAVAWPPASALSRRVVCNGQSEAQNVPVQGSRRTGLILPYIACTSSSPSSPRALGSSLSHHPHCAVPTAFAPQLRLRVRRQGHRDQGRQERERKLQGSSMENLKEQRGQEAAGANGWMTVPAFGDWDMKNGALPDYSMDFSKIREMRKQNKKELSRASIGGDDDLPTKAQQQQQRSQAQANAQPTLGRPADDHRRPLHARDHSPTGGKKFLSYFQCCIKA